MVEKLQKPHPFQKTNDFSYRWSLALGVLPGISSNVLYLGLNEGILYGIRSVELKSSRLPLHLHTYYTVLQPKIGYAMYFIHLYNKIRDKHGRKYDTHTHTPLSLCTKCQCKVILINLKHVEDLCQDQPMIALRIKDGLLRIKSVWNWKWCSFQ